MIQAVSGVIAKQSRYFIQPKSGLPPRWRTDYMGVHNTPSGEIEDSPQAFLTEMGPNSTIGVHFHSVDQFQVLLAGSGVLAGNAVKIITFYYVDHHTVNGPTNAGPFGLSIFTVRTQSDPGALHLHRDPHYQDSLKPTKKRYLLTEDIALSTEPVLQNRSEISLESVLKETDGSDGLGAFMLRLGAGMKTTGPDPKNTGGQYYLVVNGSLQLDGASYAAWSTVYATSTEAPLEVHAGLQGLEALVLNFPRPET